MKKRTVISILLTGFVLFLSNKLWLNTVKFSLNFYIFISISVLAFLLFYKLTNYLAEFKDIKNKSVIEIIFLTVFFIALFVPMSHINKNSVSEQENRTLAKLKPFFIEQGKINYDFGKNFNDWFNDRFFTREYIVSNDFISYKLAKRYYEKGHFCLDKKTHWIVNTDVFKASSDLYGKEDLDKAVYNVQKLKDFCNQNNIKLYILIAPRKEEIYPDVVKKYSANFSQYEKTNQMRKYITDKTGIPIIYPFEELKELSKHDFAYFKTDHHWTDNGAYIGYAELMKVIQKDFPNLYINKKSDFDTFYSNKIRIHQNEMFEGISYKLMGLHDKSLLDTKYEYLKYKNYELKIEKCLNSKSLCKIHHFKTTKATPNLTVYGDSFMLNLLQSLPYSFGKTEGIYIAFPLAKYKMKTFEQHIKDVKTNILVLCFCEIDHLTELYE